MTSPQSSWEASTTAVNLPPEPLRRLQRFLLAHHNGFSLVIVEAPQLDVRADLANWLKAECAKQNRSFEYVSLEKLEAVPAIELLNGFGGKDQVYFLTGLDAALTSSQNASELATLLNQLREAIAEWLNGPVFLAIGQTALRRLAIDAPDFLDWRSAEVVIERASVAELGAQNQFDFGSSNDSSWRTMPPKVLSQRSKLLERALASATSSQSRAAILLQLGDITFAQRDFEGAVKWFQRAVETLQTQGSSNDEKSQDLLGRAFQFLSLAWAEQGNLELALSSAGQSLNIWRQLVADRPDAFLPVLARALNNYAIRLSALGQLEPALAAAIQSLDIRRQLASDRPDAFLPDLAASLNNYANFLSALGQRKSALVASLESLTIYRQLAAARADTFLPDLARSFHTRGTILEDPSESVAAFQQALESIRIPLQKVPQAHLPLAIQIVQGYLQACQSAKVEPDQELLLPIVEILKQHSLSQPETSFTN